ncbi:MAG: family phosphatase [Actinomycetia bacterium]|nr:family phosphatase [Actinomycetes bacterium]
MKFEIDGNRSLSALIFDLDGLMIDSERAEREAWQAAARKLDREISDAVFSGMIGLSHAAVRSYLIQAWSDKPGAEDDFDRIYMQKSQLASKLVIEKKSGLDSLMSWAEALSMPMAIASSTRRDLVIERLDRAGINDRRFREIVCGDDVAEVKPAPDIYLLAAGKLRIEPRACMALEDSDNGIRAAYAAGMIPVLVPDYSLRATSVAPADIAALAYAEFASLGELENYLRKKIRP